MNLLVFKISNLLNFYMTNTMSLVITADFLTKVENLKIRSMLEFALKIANFEV
jgi:hypothetical protein